MQEEIKRIFENSEEEIWKPEQDCFNCLEAQCRRKNISPTERKEEIILNWSQYELCFI